MLTQHQIDEMIQGWPELPADIEQQLRDIALPHSRYLFYRRGKAVDNLGDVVCDIKPTAYYGFCTHCQTQSQLECSPEHNKPYNCPVCGSVCIAKKYGLGTTRLFESGNLNVLQAADNKLYIRQLHAYLDYRKDKLHPTFKYYDSGYRWLLSTDGCYKLLKQGRSWGQQKSFTIDHNWAPCSDINAKLLNSSYLKNSHAMEYLSMTRNQLNELILYAAAYTKHPNIESFVNERYYVFAKEYVKGERSVMNRIVNWKKTRPHEMLRIQKEELPEFMRLFRSRPEMALCYQRVRLAGQHLTDSQLHTLAELWHSAFKERPVREGIKDGRILKMLNYLQRQYKVAVQKYPGQHHSLNSMVTVWRDYLDECTVLEYDLTKDSIYYPSDLIKQHNRTMKLIKIKSDELSCKRAAARVKKLSWMTFEKDGLLIRPAESANALAYEGKALDHCVATYSDRHISGKTAIFFIRQNNQPDTSYFTLELNEKDFFVKQNRGYRNCAPPEDVKAFVEAWLQWLPVERKRLDSLKRKVLKTA
ncbi:PcfJ domain-containing protein [Oscillospiraceae bacterium MB24-C1]|nr:PcfJ domain-containing protein [Oscillospiraceae bacterium MB24-C1]